MMAATALLTLMMAAELAVMVLKAWRSGPTHYCMQTSMDDSMIGAMHLRMNECLGGQNMVQTPIHVMVHCTIHGVTHRCIHAFTEI